MRFVAILLCPLVFSSFGCTAQQTGKYAVTGVKFEIFQEPVGFVAMVKGHLTEQPGYETRLLTLVVIAPFETKGSGSSIGQQHIGDISIIEREWNIDPPRGFKLKWDRGKDVIQLGESNFARGDYDGLLAVQTENQNWKIVQFNVDSSALSTDKLLDHLAQHTDEFQELLDSIKTFD